MRPSLLFFSGYERLLAWRYLLTSHKGGFVSIIAMFSFLGIVLGVATLIIVMSVMNGFRHELTSKILGMNGHIFIQAPGPKLRDYQTIDKKIDDLDGVLLSAPILEGQILASSQSHATGAIARAMEKTDFKRLQDFSLKIIAGDADALYAQNGVAIGVRMAQSLSIGLGDHIRLLSPKGATTPFGIVPRQKSYPVAAIFEIGMSEFDSSIVFMPLAEAQRYFDQIEAVSLIEIFVRTPDTIDSLLNQIKSRLSKNQVVISDWRFRNSTFFNALQIERNVMFLILALIILVATFNIVSGLTMLVKDKKQSIAILRTMGAESGSIMRVFFLTGSLIGVSGTLCGWLLGVFVTRNIEEIRQFLSTLFAQRLFPPELYFLDRLPAIINPSDVTMILGLSLALSFFATLYPAWSAARLDPAETLRAA